MMRMISVVLLVALPPALALSADSPSTSAPPDEHDWATYNYDVSGSRYNHSEDQLGRENVKQLVEKWRFPQEGQDEKVGVIHATPTVVNGYVYFGTATYPRFYKLTPRGEVKWSYRVGTGRVDLRRQERGPTTRLVPVDGVYSSALVTHDSVYFADGAGVIYALDRETGEEKWKVDSRADDFPGAHPANLFLSSPIIADGKLIMGGGAYEHATVLEPGYKCCRGRGCVVALQPDSGRILWKYDVGPEPETFDPPQKIKVSGVQRTYYYGPSTSSVWCTPSFDASTHTIFFGTDVHNAPRRPTDDDPRNYTQHSAAIIALDVRDGSERWITQITKGDVWNHTLPTYDRETGQYKDQSIGDTPKIYDLDLAGAASRVVGVGSKNGGFYVLRADSGEILFQTPLYTGPPTRRPTVDPRTLALPSPIGGLQTGCATDGRSIFTNGIDAVVFPPIGGRVTSISLDTRTENWRHERPTVPRIPRSDGQADFTNVGDPVASGIAVANGVLYFTTLVSNKLMAVDSSDGRVLKEITLGPVFAGPSVSRGRVYIGTGNTLWNPSPREDFFPKKYTGELRSFGLPSEDEVDRMGDGNE